MPYNPSNFITSSKAYARSTGGPVEARSYYYDEVLFLERPYQSTSEVLVYLNTSDSRKGNFSIFINPAGVLQDDGSFTGGEVKEYWFKDGTDSGDLIEKITSGGGDSPITSVFGRVGVVVPTSGDYTAAQVTNAVSTIGSYSNPTWLTGLAWSKISSTPTTRSGYGITDVQPLDSDLTTIASLSATTDNVIQSVGSAWASRTPAQLKATLALVKGEVGLGNVDNTSDTTKNAASVTLTNKTISGASNTITNLGTSSLSNDAVTFAKMQNISTGVLLGRSTASSGDVEQITLDSSLDLTSGVLSVVGGGGGSCFDTLGIFSANINSTIALSTTNYVSLNGGSLGTTTLSKAIIIPVSGTLQNLFVLASGTQPASGALTITIMTGSSIGSLANSDIVLTLAANTAAGSGTVYSDTEDSVDVSAGDLLIIKVVNAATATSLTLGSISLSITN